MKTNDYEMFKFRADNREKIDQNHVLRLVDSIKSRNLLDLRPIIVNEEMEVIDGQHRLLAAKILQVEIYYQIEKTMHGNDIILMNIAKSWTTTDYLNYYCKNEYSEYIKLKEFMKKNQLNLKIALNMIMGASRAQFRDFKSGDFKFLDGDLYDNLDVCWDTINLIKKMNGFSPYTSSTRFWKALIKLINHPHFFAEKWIFNLQRMIERFSPKATTADYCRLMMEIYNWKNSDRVYLLDEV